MLIAHFKNLATRCLDRVLNKYSHVSQNWVQYYEPGTVQNEHDARGIIIELAHVAKAINYEIKGRLLGGRLFSEGDVMTVVSNTPFRVLLSSPSLSLPNMARFTTLSLLSTECWNFGYLFYIS